MAQAVDGAGYSIAAVSKLTGISCHALRVWERRYGFPIPHRSASGHRRYATEQVGVLREVAALTQAGQPIGEVVEKVQAGSLPAPRTAEGSGAEKAPATRVVDLLFAGDLVGAEAVLDRFYDRMPPFELVEQIIEPALIEIGERWFRHESSIYQERSAIANVGVLINRLIDKVRRANPHPRCRVLVGSVQGDLHEGGMLLACLGLELAGWRAIPIGVDVPIREFQKAVENWKPDALALSFVLSRNINKRFAELARITTVPVFVGGRSIVNHQGLARRNGLIPLVGALPLAVEQLVAVTEDWHARRTRSRPAGSPGFAPAEWTPALA